MLVLSEARRTTQSRYSQVKLVPDERVFEGFEMGARLRVPVDVKVWDVRMKGGADFVHNRVPEPSDARPFPQLTLLLH